MQDILRNGPASVDFLANDVFANYKDGILSEKGIQEIQEKALGSEVKIQTDSSDPEDVLLQIPNSIFGKTMDQSGFTFVS